MAPQRTMPWLVRLGVGALALAALVGLRLLIYPSFEARTTTAAGQVYIISVQIILRGAFAAVASFLIVVGLSPGLIRFLVRQKVGDRPEFDHGQLNDLTRYKHDTPTMGGLLIIAAIGASMLLFGDLRNMYVRMSFLALLWLGALGAVDDWFKLRRKALEIAGKPHRDGLKSWQKILFQIALAMLLGVFIFGHGSARSADYPEVWRGGAGADGAAPGEAPLRWANAMRHFHLPLGLGPVRLSLLGFVIVAVLVMVGTSNAVNLTDGMDGLAGGCMVVVTGVFLVLSWVAGVPQWAAAMGVPYVPGAGELVVLCAAMIGACVGFLWYNSPPAQYFMGDTGSLTLGGLLGYIAVVTRQEIMLLIAGGVFVMEAMSVVLQVGYFKATGGKRIFRCAPIHHHFHLAGWAESKVVVRFWLLSILLSALAMATLKLR